MGGNIQPLNTTATEYISAPMFLTMTRLLSYKLTKRSLLHQCRSAKTQSIVLKCYSIQHKQGEKLNNNKWTNSFWSYKSIHWCPGEKSFNKTTRLSEFNLLTNFYLWYSNLESQGKYQYKLVNFYGFCANIILMLNICYCLKLLLPGWLENI